MRGGVVCGMEMVGIVEGRVLCFVQVQELMAKSEALEAQAAAAGDAAGVLQAEQEAHTATRQEMEAVKQQLDAVNASLTAQSGSMESEVQDLQRRVAEFRKLYRHSQLTMVFRGFDTDNSSVLSADEFFQVLEPSYASIPAPPN